MYKIKPCAHCGEKEVEAVQKFSAAWIQCYSCPARIYEDGKGRNLPRLVEAWNRREGRLSFKERVSKAIRALRMTALR